MRPKSIVRYELFYLGAVLLGIAATALSWHAMIRTDQYRQIQGVLGSSFLPVFYVFVYTLSLALWYFTARVPNRAAKAIVVGWFVLSAAGAVAGIVEGGLPMGPAGLLSIAALALNAVAVWFLLRPDARGWFARAA